MSTDSFAAPSILRPEYHKYFQPRRVEVVPGLQNDGRLTVRHPFVGRFLARTPSISPTDGRKPPAEAWWYKGMKKRSVSEVLDVGAELDEYQSECVFVLAALKVLHHPQHAKHFAFWGREPAPKTAERVQRVLQLSPCPIESPVGWIGIPENMWLLDGLQSSLFPTKKEGKKVENGMLLRKRKAQANAAAAALAALPADVEERPKKRTRTTKATEKENTEVAASADPSELPALPLPQLDVIPSTEEDKPVDKAMKLELIGVNSPFTESVVIESSPARPARHTVQAGAASPEVTRRSTRQANKKLPGGPASAASTPMTELGSLPDTLSPVSSVPAEVEEAQRPPITRARSSSSSSGSSTAVSDTGSGGDTAVEPDAVESDGKGKASAKRKRVDEEAQAEADKTAVRTSGRVRKPAKKVLHVDEEALSPKKAAATLVEGRKTRAKRS